MFASFRFRRGAAAAALVFLLGCAAGLLLQQGFRRAAPASAAVQEEGVSLPAVMYHGLLRDKSLQNEYVIDPALFESDLCWLRANGYTPVHITDLLAYADGEGTLPEKPILLTFDDGYYNNYLYAYPLARQYNMKIVIAPIGYYSDLYSETGEERAPYTHLTWDRMREMRASGLVEFQNHSYNLHALTDGRTGSARCEGEGDDAYCALLSSDLTAMQEKLREELGEPASCFVYPFGAVGSGEEEIVQGLGFRCTLTCEDRINWITRKGGFLSLGRRLRPPDCSSAAFFADLLGS